MRGWEDGRMRRRSLATRRSILVSRIRNGYRRGAVVYFINRLYSSIFQHERKNEQSLHLSVLFFLIRYSLPGMLRTLFSIIPAIHGGVCDLQPCLLSQLMQYPCFGLIGISMGTIGHIRLIFCFSRPSRLTPNDLRRISQYRLRVAPKNLYHIGRALSIRRALREKNKEWYNRLWQT